MKNDSTFLTLTIALLLLVAVFFVIERGAGKKRSGPWRRRGWLVDVCFWFFTPLVTKVLTRSLLLVPATTGGPGGGGARGRLDIRRGGATKGR